MSNLIRRIRKARAKNEGDPFVRGPSNTSDRKAAQSKKDRLRKISKASRRRNHP